MPRYLAVLDRDLLALEGKADWLGREGLAPLKREEKSQCFQKTGDELPAMTPFEKESDCMVEESLEPFWGLVGSPES